MVPSVLLYAWMWLAATGRLDASKFGSMRVEWCDYWHCSRHVCVWTPFAIDDMLSEYFNKLSRREEATAAATVVPTKKQLNWNRTFGKITDDDEMVQRKRDELRTINNNSLNDMQQFHCTIISTTIEHTRINCEDHRHWVYILRPVCIFVSPPLHIAQIEMCNCA